MDTLKLILKKNILDLSYVIKNTFFVISMISFLTFSWVMVSVFIPLKCASNQIMFLSLYLLSVLGSLSYDWSKSVLKNNETISGISRLIYYLSLLITTIIIGNAVSFLMIMGNVCLNQFGLLLGNWGFLTKPHNLHLYWNQVSLFSVFYAININILLTFSFYFLTFRLFDDKKSYFSFIMCMAVLMIIFGATFNNYFWCNHYTEVAIWDNVINISYTFQPSKSFFPKEMFLPTLLFFPFYSVFQFYGLALNNPLMENWNHLSISKESYLPFLFNFKDNNHWQWSLCLIMPYIHMFLFGIAGTSMSKMSGV